MKRFESIREAPRCGEPLKLKIPSKFRNLFGAVIIQEIYGQSAGLPPKSVMAGYGGVSTTERVPVRCDGLANRSGLKVQSSPNLKGWVSRMKCKCIYLKTMVRSPRSNN